MDVYPVTLTRPDGETLTKCKARIDAAGIVVWRWDTDQQTGVVAYQSDIVEQRNPRRWVSGDAIVTRAAGCGCGAGSQLKRWRPPAGNVAVAQ